MNKFLFLLPVFSLNLLLINCQDYISANNRVINDSVNSTDIEKLTPEINNETLSDSVTPVLKNTPEAKRPTVSQPTAIPDEEDIISLNEDLAEPTPILDTSPVAQASQNTLVKTFSRGNKIAYASAENDKNEIYLVNTDGKDKSLLTNVIRNSFKPVFANDAGYIYYIYTLIDNNNDIYRCDQQGKNIERITKTANKIDAFDVSDEGNVVFISNGQFFLQEGDKLYQLGKNSLNIKNPIWINNDYIAFLIMENELSGSIYQIGKYGKGAVRLTEDIDIQAFDIKDNFLVYIDSQGVWQSDINGDNNKIIYKDFEIDEVSISPDKQKIAFTSEKSGVEQIYTVNINGDNPKQITNCQKDCFNPEW